MKNIYLSALSIILISPIQSFSQKTMMLDVFNMAAEKNLEVYNRKLTTINENGYRGIRLSKDTGEGVAWIKDIQLANGIIEFDVRGENVKQHSFTGLAFHGLNNDTYDAVYFRPFQFKEQDEVLKKRRVQYISLPNHTWRKLREQFPGKYENAVEPAPDPDAWFRVRIVIKDSIITTYINGSKEPCLTVTKLTAVKSGAIGFYVADTSGGDFANLTITKTE